MASKDQGSRKTTETALFGRRNNLVEKFGVKITSAQREYYRYTGISAEVERHALGPLASDPARLPDKQKKKQDPA
jgi:hypothetical protein